MRSTWAVPSWGRGAAPLLRLREADGGEHNDGAVAVGACGADSVCGSYLHGLFDHPTLRGAFLNRLRGRLGLPMRESVASSAMTTSIASQTTWKRTSTWSCWSASWTCRHGEGANLHTLHRSTGGSWLPDRWRIIGRLADLGLPHLRGWFPGVHCARCS